MEKASSSKRPHYEAAFQAETLRLASGSRSSSRPKYQRQIALSVAEIGLTALAR
jgi:hypothetical protein